jgi:retron-type reverse transcriptase
MTHNDKTVGSNNQAFKRLEPCARKPACTVPRGAGGGNITGLLDVDNIDHDMLLKKLNTFPKLRQVIKKWLRAGVMEGNVFQKGRAGTPQGGVISPLLANIALHGLEYETKKALSDDLFQYRKLKFRKTGHRDADNTLAVIRYADDCAPRAQRRIT